MNARTRVMNRLAGRPVDRPPNLNIIMTFGARYLDMPYRAFATDYRERVRANLRCCEDFGIDILSTMTDPYCETAGFGARLEYPEDGIPACPIPLLHGGPDLRKLSVHDPLECERMLDRIRAVELYRRKAGADYPVLGWVEGAFAEANDLRGMNEIMVDLAIQPDFVHELLELCLEQAIRFAHEQIRAGADFIGIGDAAASLIGPENYRVFALPYERRLVAAIHEAGARVKLHICGNIGPLLGDIVTTGADIIDVDWMVNFGEAVRTFAGRCSACGNFDPVPVLLRGDAALVTDAVRRCVALGDATTFIAAGCEVPRDTPPANLRAVHVALAGA